MKKITTIILLLTLTYSIAQKPNKFHLERATMFTNYIADNIELSEDDKQFVYNVMLERGVNATKQIRGKNLSQEDKKAIYRAEYKNAATKLKDKFGNKKGNKIMALSNEARKKNNSK
ncbi:MAG: hypothetical protein VXZ46_00985 [Bacteroidota bacterium]|nr:hypothetical protein [Bacteroidota bacterium]